MSSRADSMLLLIGKPEQISFQTKEKKNKEKKEKKTKRGYLINHSYI